MKKVNVKTEFKDDYITRAAGERLRNMLISAKDNNEKIEVNFEGIIIASTSFFDEGFAKLAQEGWNRSDFDSFVNLIGLNKNDEKVLNEMLVYRNLI